MGKEFRLTWQLNLLLSCFGLSALYLPTQHDPAAGPASLHAPPYTKHVLIWSCSLYGGVELIQFSTKTRFPLPFSYLECYISTVCLQLGFIYTFALAKLHLKVLSVFVSFEVKLFDSPKTVPFQASNFEEYNLDFLQSFINILVNFTFNYFSLKLSEKL